MDRSADHLLGVYTDTVNLATLQLSQTLANVKPEGIEALLKLLMQSRRVACYGVGREGLAMKGLAMRLHHIGLQASVVGEMTAAAVGEGDLLLLSAGPGYFSTVAALAREAKKAGAQVVAFTSVSAGQLHVPADHCIQIPATCLPAAAPDDIAEACSTHHHVSVASASSPPEGNGSGRSALPMGSSYELALQLFGDVMCLLLQRALGASEADMRQRHTNLE